VKSGKPPREISRGGFLFALLFERIIREGIVMNQEFLAEENTHGSRSTLREIFSFPHPVNDTAARLVAGMVVALSLSIIIFQAYWLLPVLAYGFLARVLTGPTLSPMGLMATKVLAPCLKLPVKLVSGPPKRFAQTVGLIFSVTALVLHFAFALSGLASILLGVLVGFAILESVFGFCAGCFAFGILMRVGLIPEDICESCVI
jgi:hypothetical protein